MRCFIFGSPLGKLSAKQTDEGDAAITTRSRAITANAPLIRPLATFSQGRRLFCFLLHHRHQCLALALDSVRAAVGGQEVALTLLDRDGLAAAGQFPAPSVISSETKLFSSATPSKSAVLGIDGEILTPGEMPAEIMLDRRRAQGHVQRLFHVQGAGLAVGPRGHSRRHGRSRWSSAGPRPRRCPCRWRAACPRE